MDKLPMAVIGGVSLLLVLGIAVFLLTKKKSTSSSTSTSTAATAEIGRIKKQIRFLEVGQANMSKSLSQLQNTVMNQQSMAPPSMEPYNQNQSIMHDKPLLMNNRPQPSNIGQRIGAGYASVGSYLNATRTTATQARVSADAANVTAGNALTTATSAFTTATNAFATAGNAFTTASTALTSANAASALATAADTKAGNALTTATSAFTTASSAFVNSANALTTATNVNTRTGGISCVGTSCTFTKGVDVGANSLWGGAGNFSGDVSGVGGNFSGNVAGVGGNFSGDISGSNANFSGVAAFTGPGTSTFVGDVVTAGNVGANDIFINQANLSALRAPEGFRHRQKTNHAQKTKPSTRRGGYASYR